MEEASNDRIVNLVADPKRQAVSANRGYAYQAWQSVHAWISLGEGEVLFLEGAEDIDVLKIQEGQVEAKTIQVKDTHGSGSVTLNSGDVLEAVMHFWEHQRNNPSVKVNFHFLTTSERGREQNTPFHGARGLDYWDACKKQGTDLGPLRFFLQEKEALPHELRDFIASCSDEELRENLIRPILWDTGNEPQPHVEELVEKSVIEYGARVHSIPPAEALKVIPYLFKQIWEVVCQEHNRYLDHADFARLFEEVTTERVSSAELRELRRAGLAVAQAGLSLLAGGVNAGKVGIDQASRQDVEQEENINGSEVTDRVRKILEEKTQFFVGREDEFASLESYLNGNVSGWITLTGHAGFGKSAFLANWIVRLRQTTSGFVAYHFFDQRYEVSRSIRFAYLNILRQLCSYYGLSNRAQPNDEADLREAIYSLLLERGSFQGKPLVIVIDAIDEAEHHFTPPFPARLPNGVYIVVSARAGKDEELFYLKTWCEGTYQISLSRLPVASISQWLQKAGSGELARYSSNEDFIEKLNDTTQGFPLYLHFLIDEMLQEAKESSDIVRILDRSPQGFSEYVNDQLHLLAQSESFRQQEQAQKLFATLSVTLGPLSSYDVQQLTKLTVWEQRALPWQVVRWFRIQIDTYTLSYSFSHPLLANEFKQALGYEAETALRVLLEYCANWGRHDSNYILRYYAEHLYTEKAHEKLFELAKNNEFRRRQEISLTSIPTISLLTLQLAMLTALEIGEAALAVEFLLGYAHGLSRIKKDSPLEALSSGNLERAWALADLFDKRFKVLLYLMLIWMSKERKDFKEAKRTIDRLCKMEITPLAGWESDIACILLENVINLDNQKWKDISSRLLSDTAQQRLLRYVLGEEDIERPEDGEEETGNPRSKLSNFQLIDLEPAHLGRSTDAGLYAVAKRHAELGEFDLALQSAMEMEQPLEKIKCILDIALVEASYNKRESARKAFAAAMKTANDIGNASEKLKALTSIGVALAKSEERHGAQILLNLASKTLISMPASKEKLLLLRKIAESYALIGDFPQALDVARQMWATNKLVLSCKIAVLWAKAGNVDSAKSVLNDVAREVNYIKKKSNRLFVLLSIAKSMIQIGDSRTSTQLFNRALLETQKSNDDAERVASMLMIAKGTAAVGDVQRSLTIYESALFIVNAIEDQQRRSVLTQKILRVLVRLGSLSAAYELAQQLENPAVRAIALNLVAKSQSTNQDSSYADTFTLAVQSAFETRDLRERVKLLKMIGTAQHKTNLHKDASNTLKTASQLALEIPDEVARAQTLLYLVGACLNVDDFLGAISTAELISANSIQTLGYRMAAIVRIARKQARVGLWQDAIKLLLSNVLTIGSDSWEWSRAWALGAVAQVQFRDGDVDGGKFSISEAVKFLEFIDNDLSRITTQSSIATMLAKSEQYEPAKLMFASALEATTRMGADSQQRALALANIGAMHGYVGELEAARKTFAEAIQIARAIHDPNSRGNTFFRIGELQAGIGDIEHAKETFENSKEAAQTSNRRTSLMRAIAEAQVRAGFFHEGADTAREINDSWDWGKTLSLIQRIKENLTEGNTYQDVLLKAVQEARQIYTLRRREWALKAIADLQAKSGLGEQALLTLEAMLKRQSSAIPDMARIFIEQEDKDNFKQLLIPSAKYLDAANRMGGLIAEIFPAQATAVANVLVTFEASKY